MLQNDMTGFIGKGSNEHFDDTWVFDFTTEEWTEMNFTSRMSVPESRYYSAGRGVVEREEEEGEGDGDTMTIWMSMGVNQVGRKLSDTWTLTVNITEPFKGMDGLDYCMIHCFVV